GGLARGGPGGGASAPRARAARRSRGQADSGPDRGMKRAFYGFRLHVRASRDGVIQAYELAQARSGDRELLPELARPSGTIGIGDRGYYSPALRRRLAEAGVRLLTPSQHKTADPDPARSGRLAGVRYRLESAFGQLAERYRVKRAWARDLWHLCHRLVRAIPSPAVMVELAVRHGHQPLSFDRLLPAA